jgi:hypothetical protein
MTEPPVALAASSTTHSDRAPAQRPPAGPDRITVALFSLAAFLLVLALLGSQLGSAHGGPARRVQVVVRRIYRTTVLERVLPAGAGPAAGTTVTQSGSSPLPVESAPAAPVTRVS